MRLRRLVVTAVSGLLIAGSVARAQFPQYINPGSLALAEPDEKATIDKAMGDALWRLGDVRIQPILGVRNIGYVSNISGDPGHRVDDYTGTAVIGVKAYLPVGKKVILAAHALPEYAWWKKTDPLRGWQYRYGAGLFGYFNRLTLTTKFTAEDQQSYVSNELDSPANITHDRGEVNAAIRVSGPISIFFGGSEDKSSYDDNGLGQFFPTVVENLNRRETVLRGGVKYKRENGFELGLGYERDKTDFSRSARDRSNSGGGPVLTIHHTGSRWTMEVDASYRTLKERQDATFRRFKSVSGSGRLGLKTGGRTEIDVYGSKGLFYTLQAGTDYADEQREGISGQILIGWRTQLRAYLEIGEANYRASFEPLDELRKDDFNTTGIEAQFKLGESATLRLGYSHTKFDSNQDNFDRTLNNIQISLNFGGIGSAW